MSSLKQAGIVVGLTMVLCGVAYPLALTVAGQALFPNQAEGSLIERDGERIGSKWIAQPFASDGYFHGRPTAVDQLTGQSGGDNMAESNPDRPKHDPELPGAIETSGSGLDPHISMEHAMSQVERISDARSVAADDIEKVIRETADGEPYVNVLMMNLALDELN
ncbi:MAG: potassium-transporting ATPase subunit C [Exiguobacterium sp.]|uniref:potassium-transporting ATPase subunit C n=1 Tax=Exiguobacterium TaxID=33986 RepID=UPI0025BC18AB|nr:MULTISPECIES: potassium-transporting ATPase subunit C [Exiguobacterium]MBR2077363.1 potassium-transporting ATPase subunit C [Exiguobacterium sp.]MBR2681117.1 potassium-transporting ATPase subunit C [Exiguobacterium sp.]MBR2756657.1 potassium-transporting ATPase subunit C [Exiguobacterium sp.]MBR3063518.1 potassium-transporting ATPase subunit C [Exiguobacterium sp.]MBR3215594.1 potassium-transporting ATPase subunit C [Exiguobacterium sp.]